MAYNLQSLITILQQILDPQQTCWIGRKKSQLRSLLQKAVSLQQILERSSLIKIESLESQIREAAHKAEDIIESHMVDQILSTPQGMGFTIFATELQQVTQELDSAMEQVVKLKEMNMVLTGSSSSGASHSHDQTQQIDQAVKLVEVDEKKTSTGGSWSDAPNFSSSKNNLVGVDADLMQLKDRLTNMECKLEIIPIVGMGGIGKSTLARNLYHDPLIVEHFAFRGWAAISQVHNMQEVLLSLLCGPNENLSHELIGLHDNELKDILYKRLFGRKYFIVLDDIWSSKFWDEIRMYFPENKNGSRIVITTRELDVARYVNRNTQHHVQLLNRSASWDLLRQIVFGEEDCSPELRKIGTNIAGACGGLPLAIHVIGGLLSKVERSRFVWLHIATDVKAAIFESDNHFSNILSLSYNHLPTHLKPCFLYLGSFPKVYDIKGSRLMHMWIAEGFVKSNGNKSLEEEAEDYLKTLVERNLLFVREKKSNGKPMSYSIHDLLKDLCIKKANEEKFLCVKNISPDVMFSNQRRLSVHSSYDEMRDVYASSQLMSLARSFVCTKYEIIFSIFPILRLVRVLDLIGMVFKEFPKEILQLVNLRYLAFSCTSDLPIGISRLWNLQTLISREDITPLPSEIWEISELRHLRLDTLIQIEEGYEMKFVHEKLQTIYFVRVTPSLIRRGFFGIIPNIKKLGIYYIDSPYVEVDLSHHHKLETLRCESKLNVDGSRFLPKLRFPCNLRKLSLGGCVIFRSFLTTLCALPKLEVLRILECVFEREADEDEEWEVAEGDEFSSLLCLHLESLNVVRWRANETNFPRLRVLLVCSCYELEEIPGAIGDIPTLQEIEIWECGASVVASAREIQKVQQEEYDNYDLQLLID